MSCILYKPSSLQLYNWASLNNHKIFFVFRKLKETTWVKTEDQLNENSIVVKGLEPGHTYQFRVVAVDGESKSINYRK